MRGASRCCRGFALGLKLPLGTCAGLARELLEAKEDGRVKLYVTWRGLSCRQEHRGLF